MSYYNTTNQSGDTLKEYKRKALTQEEEIFHYLSRYGLTFSASEIQDSLFKDRNVPITSIRRALTNLYHDLEIKKAGQIKGKYGRPENTYKAISAQVELF
jgi:response regulator of citrate/malate metabolism